jgi:hypothetical protein
MTAVADLPAMQQMNAAQRLAYAINHGEAMTYAEQLTYIGHLEEIRAELRNVLQRMLASPDRVAAASIAADVIKAYDAMLADQNDCLSILN